MLQICSLKVSDSNFGRATGCPDQHFLRFPQSPHPNAGVTIQTAIQIIQIVV